MRHKKPKAKNPVQLEEIKERLQMMRMFARDVELFTGIKLERGFHGAKAITAYLRDELDYKRSHNRPLGKNTVRNWVETRGFPNCDIDKANGMFATNLQILAWLWSLKTWHKMRARRVQKYVKPQVPVA